MKNLNAESRLQALVEIALAMPDPVEADTLAAVLADVVQDAYIELGLIEPDEGECWESPSMMRWDALVFAALAGCDAAERARAMEAARARIKRER